MLDLIGFIANAAENISDLVEMIRDFFKRKPRQSLPRCIAMMAFRFALLILLPIAVLASCAAFASLPRWGQFVAASLLAIFVIIVLVQMARAFIQATREIAAEVKKAAEKAL